MSMFLTLAFLFAIGSVAGWVLEVFFRRFYSAGNPGRKWINPGFCTGPYLPIYGCGLCVLYLISISQMINHIENPALLATKIIVPYYLVERQSCCPPKQ